MSGLDIPERAYQAAEGALASWPVLTEEALFDAISAAAPVIVAAELRRMVAAERFPGRAATSMRAAELDPKGVGRG